MLTASSLLCQNCKLVFIFYISQNKWRINNASNSEVLWRDEEQWLNSFAGIGVFFNLGLVQQDPLNFLGRQRGAICSSVFGSLGRGVQQMAKDAKLLCSMLLSNCSGMWHWTDKIYPYCRRCHQHITGACALWNCLWILMSQVILLLPSGKTMEIIGPQWLSFCATGGRAAVCKIAVPALC